MGVARTAGTARLAKRPEVEEVFREYARFGKIESSSTDLAVDILEILRRKGWKLRGL